MLFSQLLEGILTRIGLIGKQNSAYLVVSAINMEQKSGSYHVVADLREILIAVPHITLTYLTTYGTLLYCYNI